MRVEKERRAMAWLKSDSDWADFQGKESEREGAGRTHLLACAQWPGEQGTLGPKR